MVGRQKSRATVKKASKSKCLTAHDGWVWMPTFDRLPAIIRKRLSESRFNICAACMAIEAEEIARERRVKPSAANYLETINWIEREMKSTDLPLVSKPGHRNARAATHQPTRTKWGGRAN
jgi:hypothetical protein